VHRRDLLNETIARVKVNRTSLIWLLGAGVLIVTILFSIAYCKDERKDAEEPNSVPMRSLQFETEKTPDDFSVTEQDSDQGTGDSGPATEEPPPGKGDGKEPEGNAGSGDSGIEEGSTSGISGDSGESAPGSGSSIPDKQLPHAEHPPVPREELEDNPAVIVDAFHLEETAGLWREKGKTEPFTGVARRNYPNGNPLFEIHYRNGKRHGKQVIWKETSEVLRVVDWADGLKIN
jgi:hypothetical protein